MWPRTCLLAAFCLFAALAGAQAASPDQSAPPLDQPRENCTLAESIPLDNKAFRRDPDRFGGRCVHVRGIIYERGFVRDATELYEYETQRDKRPMIAVYGKERAGDMHLWGSRTYADIVAYTYSCKRLWDYASASAKLETAAAQARGDDTLTIPFVAGRCHYDDGPVLWVSDWTPLPELPTRLYDSAAARKYRNLDEVRERWRHYDEVKRIVITWLDLVRTRDRAGLTDFLARMGGTIDGLAPKEADGLTDPVRSPVAFLIGRPATPNVTIFLQRRQRGDNERDYMAYGCMCKEPDCSKRWPFHSADTDTLSPYLCIGVGADVSQPPRLEEYPVPPLEFD
jgi:hypothetical protein